jgi:hypothetical protein
MPNRNHCVSVRLDPKELAELDELRGRIRRGTYLRLCFLGNPPPVIPSVNREAWVALARAAGNLNQITTRLNTGDLADIKEIREALKDFRLALITASKPRTARDEDHEGQDHQG